MVMHDGNGNDEFGQLDDIAFLAERRRVREALEHTPAQEQDPDLTAHYQRLTEEFDRRARAAWAGEGRRK
jgi:hypothetical protein